MKARLGARSDWLADRDPLLVRFTAADILMATVRRFVRHTTLTSGYPVADACLKRREARSRFQKASRDQLAG